MSGLHVITSVFNPSNYTSRYRLYESFSKRISGSGATLHTVELVFENQDFAVTSNSNPLHLQLRTSQKMWFKENLINIAISNLPASWRYVAWLDADIAFVQQNWVESTLSQLNKFPLVQMFSHLIDLGPTYEPIGWYRGFAFNHCQNDRTPSVPTNAGQPGYAWAARREAIESLGGLIDWSILGANDYYMALGLVEKLDPALTYMPESNYARTLLKWQENARRFDQQIGYVDATLLHYWHGSRRNRGYGTRWKILHDHDFDPCVDLARASSGLLKFTDNKPLLQRAVAEYFDRRKEDSLDRD
jgi:hypothetical protein